MARNIRRLKSAAKQFVWLWSSLRPLPEILLQALGIILVVALTGQSAFAQEGAGRSPEGDAKKEREKIVDMSVLFKYEAGEEGSLVQALFGLFKLEKEGAKYSLLTVRPFLYRESDDKRKIYDTTLFYGLAAWRTNRETFTSWAIPLYYFKRSPERKTVLAPFIYTDSGKDFSTWLFYPFFGHSKWREGEKYYFGFPFFSYAHYKSGRQVIDAPFPLIKYSSGPDGSWFHLFPFIWYDADPAGDGVLVVFPTLWARSAADSHLTLLFPVYWDYASGDSSFFMVLPFYGYSEAQDYRSDMVGFPLFSYATRRIPDYRELGYCDRQVDLVWPIFMLRTAPHVFHFRLFPIYYGKDYNLTESAARGEATSTYFYIFPIFWYHDYPDSQLFHLWPYGYLKSKDGKESHYYLAFPLVHVHRYEPQGLLEVSIPLGLPLFKYESINATVDTLEGKLTGKQRNVWLFPIFYLLTRPGTFEFVSLPLTYREQIDYTGEKYSYTNILFWSFSGKWYKDESDWRLFYALLHYEGSKDSAGFYVLDLTFLLDWQLFSYVSKKEEERLELSPIFKYRSEKGDYEFDTLLGLFGWGRKKGDTYLKLLWFLKPKL
jgi:hypothetical protein